MEILSLAFIQLVSDSICRKFRHVYSNDSLSHVDTKFYTEPSLTFPILQLDVHRSQEPNLEINLSEYSLRYCLFRASCSKEIHDCQVQTLKSLQSIWTDMGVHGEAKAERLESFRTHVLVSFIKLIGIVLILFSACMFV